MSTGDFIFLLKMVCVYACVSMFVLCSGLTSSFSV